MKTADTFDPTLLVAGDFIPVRLALVDALDGDWPSAILLQYIHYRCQGGSWTATQEQVAQECRMALRTVQRVLGGLLEAGLLVRTSASRWDRTSVWSLPDGLARGVPGGRSGAALSANLAGGRAANLADTSSKNLEEEDASHLMANHANSSGGGDRSTPRGTRLDPDWSPSEDLLVWARSSFPDLDLDFQTDSFRDYWVAIPGARGVKLNWDTTWRNWMRKSAARPATSRRDYAADAQALAERLRRRQEIEQALDICLGPQDSTAPARRQERTESSPGPDVPDWGR